MNPDLKVKQHIQILIGVIIAWFLFTDKMIQGNKPSDIKKYKGQIAQFKDQISKYEQLENDNKNLLLQSEENKQPFLDLFAKFPNSENTENELSAMIASITQKLIVKNEKLKPKKIKEYIPQTVENYTVPQITPNDPPMSIDSKIQIATYESELLIKCNYFELLEFLHKTANQDIFLTPMDLAIEPEAEFPYGVQAKVRLLTFGFEKEFNKK